jgi:hypothetical protein
MIGVHEAFRKMNGTTQKPLQNGSNLTLPALLNKVPAARKNLSKNIVLASEPKAVSRV